MNTDKMIPIDFSRNITPFVPGDALTSNAANGYDFTVTSDRVDFFNSKDSDDQGYFVISFADRPNTGKQPVADWVPVDYVIEGRRKVDNCLASDVEWEDYYKESAMAPDLSHRDISKYRPNFDALHDIYTKEIAMQKTLPKQGDSAQIPDIGLPATAQANDKPVLGRSKIKSPRKHAEMAAEFMSDERIGCELLTKDDLWVNTTLPCWCERRTYRLIHPKTDEDKLIEAIMDELNCDKFLAKELVFADKFTITLNKVGE